MVRRQVSGVMELELGPDRILRVSHHAGAQVDGAHAREAIGHLLELAGRRRIAVLIDVRNVRGATREARELLAGPDVAVWVTRLALLIEGPVSAMIGNFFLRVTRPAYPTRIFKQRDAAERWLAEAARDEEAP